jgi:hypothetical protein
MNKPLKFFDEKVVDKDENANKVKLMVETSLYNRHWRNQSFDNWFELDPEYDSDFNFDRQLTFKRYLKLVNSPAYRLEPTIESVGLLTKDCSSRLSEIKNAPLPKNLDITGRKITPTLKIKILGALPIHSHFFGDLTGAISVRILFYETKLCGFYYNYRSQKWEYGQLKKKPKKKR